jgi:hypothetical protein
LFGTMIDLPPDEGGSRRPAHKYRAEESRSRPRSVILIVAAVCSLVALAAFLLI